MLSSLPWLALEAKHLDSARSPTPVKPVLRELHPELAGARGDNYLGSWFIASNPTAIVDTVNEDIAAVGSTDEGVRFRDADEYDATDVTEEP